MSFDRWKGCDASKAVLMCYPWKCHGIKALSAPGRVEILLRESENLMIDTELAVDPPGVVLFYVLNQYWLHQGAEESAVKEVSQISCCTDSLGK